MKDEWRGIRVGVAYRDVRRGELTEEGPQCPRFPVFAIEGFRLSRRGSLLVAFDQQRTSGGSHFGW
jgi:hypothetical protein